MQAVHNLWTHLPLPLYREIESFLSGDERKVDWQSLSHAELHIFIAPRLLAALQVVQGLIRAPAQVLARLLARVQEILWAPVREMHWVQAFARFRGLVRAPALHLESVPETQ